MFGMSSRLVALAITAAIASAPIAVSQAHEARISQMDYQIDDLLG